ncbi:MAG: DEAD/DEAH box helicase [Rhodospirillaceae bacterium]|nr:DEAD/DEAH box helicase [Rhodospirillaceae bacterium]
MDGMGAQNFELGVSEFCEAIILPLVPPWYYDPLTSQCGPLKTDTAPTLCATLLTAPSISAGDAGAFRRALQDRLKDSDILLPSAPTRTIRHEIKPRPHLTLKHVTFQPDPWNRRNPHEPPEEFAFAALDFSYDGLKVLPQDSRQELEVLKADTLAIAPRNWNAEDEAMEVLDRMGLAPLYDVVSFRTSDEIDQSCYAFEDYTAGMNWLRFIHGDVPDLVRMGWKVEISDDFPYIMAGAAEDWSLTFESRDIDWFSLSLGVEVDGQIINLIPVLVDVFRQMPDDVDEEAFDYMMFGLDETAFLPVGERRFITFPAERLRPVLKTLFELFSDKDTNPEKISRLRLGEISALEEAAIQSGAIIEGCNTLRALANNLADGARVSKTPIPAGFHATLRPYQADGLDWLQFLARSGLGGILADDMGLGKTVQTLAHILAEKGSGRLDRPCLLVMPTSLIPNWRIEAERFAPSLKLLTLHGPDRKQYFEDIVNADVVLTTYPLVHRDREALLKQDYHLAIFDEAQAIKNPTANAAKFACEVSAWQKICLSGTPVENHLGELWSLFHCVVPGLLGESKAFGKSFRNPIEKHGNAEKQTILNRRVNPFLLRRTKEAVATELPPKTETIEHVALDGKQRDLYETVRLAMDKKVRAEIATKGMARSHITVLDALLKLRQTCCDPRLVKLKSARKVSASAKLERLCEMLPELIEDGRRILLFSQFTAMLALIEDELGKLEIPFVKLTGQTKDRETPVRQFQAGEVPLFLISLKAGGTGLNLTAADTVIHYDPWWNPAVENQATDRAHRIGQDKPVFVYKLAARGTVEERMIEMQARKSALAEALYDDKADPGKHLSEDDISWLLAPLEQGSVASNFEVGP